MPRNRILLVDDEPGPRFGIRRFLKSHGFDVEEADDCASAREKYKQYRPDLTIVDFRLPDGTALDLLKAFRTIDNAPIVVLTAYASIDTAVEAVKLGAEQFLTKPVDLSTLMLLVERVLENQRNKQQVLARDNVRSRDTIDPFAGTSDAIRKLKETCERVLRAESPLLLRGETGTGKTLLARWLHEHSRRSDEAFVDLNCAGIAREFLETELFGHEKGAFTGAQATKQGLLEVAHRGTVFLDEIGDMDLQVQAALLKVLEEKRFRRLGDTRDRSVDIRLIAATHHNLQRLADEGRFRQDLYFRISALEIAVPPLRERRDDIPLLARRLLAQLARDLGHQRAELTSDVEKRLVNYSWPGNLRELRNVLERALLHSPDGTLRAEELMLAETAAPPSAARLSGTLEEVERQYLEQVLAEENGNADRAAERLGISRSAVYYKLRKHKR
jgi:DNA-binding NtrC family response regulator